MMISGLSCFAMAFGVDLRCDGDRLETELPSEIFVSVSVWVEYLCNLSG